MWYDSLYVAAKASLLGMERRCRGRLYAPQRAIPWPSGEPCPLPENRPSQLITCPFPRANANLFRQAGWPKRGAPSEAETPPPIIPSNIHTIYKTPKISYLT